MQRRQFGAFTSTAVAGVASWATGLSGCALMSQPSHLPMDVDYDINACAKTQAPVLLVLLPGANMTTQELQEEGFVAAVRKQGLAVDVAIADANLRYVFDGSMMRRMADEVVGPARAQGYQRIWLAGISLGGYVALGYAQKHPGQIEGLMLMAPYLGRRGVIDDIRAAGGPAAWRRTAQPRTSAATPEDIDHGLWMWLTADRDNTLLADRDNTSNAAQRPPIWLGYGSEDRFADSHKLLAGLLPTDRVQAVPGGHDWPPWRALWSQWLQRGAIRGACAA
jgi:pimeloyl-ACP methyl ester carboxylesterase